MSWMLTPSVHYHSSNVRVSNIFNIFTENKNTFWYYCCHCMNVYDMPCSYDSHKITVLIKVDWAAVVSRLLFRRATWPSGYGARFRFWWFAPRGFKSHCSHQYFFWFSNSSFQWAPLFKRPSNSSSRAVLSKDFGKSKSNIIAIPTTIKILSINI